MCFCSAVSPGAWPFEGAMGATLCPHVHPKLMAFESTHRNVECVADLTTKALYVRKGANSWAHFRVALQLCFFGHWFSGSEPKTAAEVAFGWLSHLAYI